MPPFAEQWPGKPCPLRRNRPQQARIRCGIDAARGIFARDRESRKIAAEQGRSVSAEMGWTSVGAAGGPHRADGTLVELQRRRLLRVGQYVEVESETTVERIG